MARTTPVNAGYSIINGSATGSNKAYVDVWLEWKQLSKDTEANTSKVRVVLYSSCTTSSSTSWYSAEKFGYVGYDGANKQYRSTTYNFANKAVNCFGDYTFTVAHNSDGTKSIKLEGAWSTSHSIYISGGSVSGTVALETIPRASSITSASNVTLGNTCSIKWTPNSASFRYKLKLSIGSWAYTTAAIHPNKTSAYTYTGYKLPIAVAEQIPNSKTGTVTVALTTYSDSGCTTAIGTDTETFTVTVPENDETKPIVTMELLPVSPIDGLYLQEASRVQAAISAEGQLKADIKSYSLAVQGRSNGSPYLSSYLTAVGDVTVTGSAVDTRGIIGTNKQIITVLPYYRPKLTGVEAYRCTADGAYAENGEYLKIEATRDYAKVVTADGVQHNYCTIAYRYKVENAEEYSVPVKILAADAESDTVETEPLLNATFSKEYGYVVQIVAEDTVGQKTVSTVQIPCERIFRHKRAGGRGLGYGGYCEEDDLLDVHWNVHVHKDLRVDGGINGIYESAEYPGCRYRIVDEETEWLNPPMVAGVEYRTAERCDGNVVYAIRLHVASLPNSISTTVELGVTIKKVVEFMGICVTASNNQVTFPIFTSSGEFDALAYINSQGQLYISTAADLRTYSAYFNVKYTKN